MNSFSLVKLLTATQRHFALLVLVCFGAMAGFSEVLHAHELEPGHIHKNCAPCKWNQLQIDSQQEISIQAFSRYILILPEISTEAILLHGLHSLSRAPPHTF
jgi:hypothetical protein